MSATLINLIVQLIAGAIVTAVVGLIKNAMAGQTLK